MNFVKDNKHKILLVEDGPAIQNLILHFLRNTPYSVVVAENGDEAVKMFKADSYNLVLMDMQMPVMDGLEACKTMRAWEKERGLDSTKIVALTATEFSENEKTLEDAGFDGYISKPVTEKVFLEHIERQMKS